jgi:Family of unknown function (DUF6496)
MGPTPTAYFGISASSSSQNFRDQIAPQAQNEKDQDMVRKYSKGAQKKVEKAMHERKEGTLRSGSGKKVKSRKQAIAIALSEARKEGQKVPRMK